MIYRAKPYHWVPRTK